jgi:hypothetical protein
MSSETLTPIIVSPSTEELSQALQAFSLNLTKFLLL